MAFKSPEENFSATLDWHYSARESHLRLSKLLGGTLFEMRINKDAAQLEIDGETYYDSDPQRLLFELTGWLIPIEQMHLWTQGIIDKKQYHPTVNRKDNGQLLDFTSADGWQVTYKSYKQQDALQLPENIIIQRDSLRIRLRINEWAI